MSRTLVVMRHAKSSWKTAEPDYRRPLSARGTRDAVVAGQILSGFPIEVVISSSATRTRQTWQHAVMGGASCPDVRFTDALYHAWTDEVLLELGTLGDSVTTALVIGHSPTMDALVLWLAQPSPLTDEVRAHFPTSAIAILGFDGDWDELSKGQARLLRYEIPRG